MGGIVSPFMGNTPIVNAAENTVITNNDDNCLKNYCDSLELVSAQGEKHSGFANKINGVTYMHENISMGIEKIKLILKGKITI